MDTVIRTFSLQGTRICIELTLREAKLFLEGHENIKKCVKEDVKKALAVCELRKL